MQDHSNAMWVEREPAIEVDDMDCFKPVAKSTPRKLVKPLALGTALAGQPILIKPVANELDAMAADLAELRLDKVEPVVRLTAEQLDEIESERPGAEISTQPFLY